VSVVRAFGLIEGPHRAEAQHAQKHGRHRGEIYDRRFDLHMKRGQNELQKRLHDECVRERGAANPTYERPPAGDEDTFVRGFCLVGLDLREGVAKLALDFRLKQRGLRGSGLRFVGDDAVEDRCDRIDQC
jgi:hypothetical protein